VSPERPSDARARLDAFLDRLLHLSIEDLRLVALPPPDPEQRAELLAAVDRAARATNRSDLVELARTKVGVQLDEAFDRHGYDATWVGLNWGVSLGPTRDRVALGLAAQDAAVAAVLQDALPEDVLADLTEPFDLAAGMAGSTTTLSGALSGDVHRDARPAWLVFALAVALVAVGALGYAAGAELFLVVLIVLTAAGIVWVARPQSSR
jgi:hypothetical protein